MKCLPALLLAFVALGCLDREEEYTINPDGAGKVKISWVGAPFDGMRAGKDDPDEIMKSTVRSQLSRAQGIDCWKDVTFSLRDDGKIAFRGTAYFKNVGAVNLEGHDRNPLSMNFTLEKDDKGNLVLSAKHEGGRAPAADKPAPDDVKKQMRKLRLKYQQVRPMVRACLAEYRSRCKLNLPGAVDEVKGFAKAEGALRLDVDGAALMKTCEELYLVDEKLQKAVEEGADLEIGNEPKLPDRIKESLFGAKELRATLKGELKKAFDYDAEVTAEVRETYAKLLESLPKEARFLGGPPDEEADDTPKKTMEEVLKENLVLDLGAETALKLQKPAEELNNLLSQARQHDSGSMSYDFSGPSYSMSGGNSSAGRHMGMKVGEGNLVERFEFRLGPDSVAVRQGPGGFLRITLENDSTGLNAILSRGSAGVQFVLMRASDTITRKWATLEEAAKTNPAELGLMLSRLKSAPIRMAPTAADAEVSALALRWTDQLDEATRRKLDEIRKRLLDESLEERNKAGAELKNEVGTDVLRLRYLAESLETVREEADARARIQAVIDGQPDAAAAVLLVRGKELYRDLAYLGALLEDSARTQAAKARLKALTGRDFATRADFDTWHAANKAKLKWDAAAGRYSTGP
jgi:hypothetical protein